MKTKFLFLTLVIVFLTSCTFNVQRENRAREFQARQYMGERPSPDWVDQRDLNNCPVYVLPATKPVPPTPSDQFLAIPKTNPDARIALLLDYIETLRTHIKESKSENTDQYVKYLLQCTAGRK